MEPYQGLSTLPTSGSSQSQKSKNSTRFKPIALCHLYYKVISKVLTKRLQPVLKYLISENQSAFFQGRSISDNVLITYEVLHFLKTSKAKERCSMAFKIDMSKAYDRLEWDFIKTVLEKFGFHSKWVQWIMQYVSTVSYSFLLNSTIKGSITPIRVIRQGETHYPLTFTLYSEVLSGLCRKAQENGSLPGLKFQGGVRESTTFYLLTTQYLSAEQTHRAVRCC